MTDRGWSQLNPLVILLIRFRKKYLFNPRKTQPLEQGGWATLETFLSGNTQILQREKAVSL